MIAYTNPITETDGRGVVKTHSYEHARGLHLGTTYTLPGQNSEGVAAGARSFSYNHLGMLTQVTDDAGTRTLTYNSYNEPETDSLQAGGRTHLITELRDDYGRSTGYTYANNGAVQQTVSTGYGEDGRIVSAGFVHGGAQKLFTYNYLPGSHLLQSLVKPNNMTLTLSYEDKRDLLTGMLYKRSNTQVASRSYTYDTLGRPTSRGTTRDGQSVSDSFAYNNRSELTSATVSGESYAYDYDNIGNRAAAVEDCSGVASRIEYETNHLNQYTAIGDFVPTFDDAGNQTLVKTSTGIWAVTYDAENRPTQFSNAESSTTVECTYDYMGRRATKKVTVNGAVTLHQRYIYRGYLQIACCDLTRSAQPALWLLTWDPTQTTATRPLAIQINGTWFTYGWDLTKNICEVFGQHGYIRTAYTYTPYGAVTMSGDLIQPIQWSSEYHDTELALVYYNYRHYNPTDGRWLGRDRLMEMAELNIYMSFVNDPIVVFDVLGEYDFVCDKNHRKWYKDFKMELYYKSLISQVKILHVEDISNMVMDFMSDWTVDKAKEKIEEGIKQSDWYRETIKEFEDIIEAFERGVQKVNTAGLVAKIYNEACFDCFRVELQAKFCCCENGGYFFEKITSLGETQTYGHYLFSPEGFEMFELHLNELPKIYSLAIDELMSKGLNCCKN